jgi:hypothetical protein
MWMPRSCSSYGMNEATMHYEPGVGDEPGWDDARVGD